MELSKARQGQLAQLRRLDPQGYEVTVQLLEKLPHSADTVISGALKKLLAPKPQVNRLTVAPIPGVYICDLTIAVKKYGYGTVSQADNPIAWIQEAGYIREVPPRDTSLLSPEIAKRLENYDLIPGDAGTEARANLIIRRYKRVIQSAVGDPAAAPIGRD